MKNIFILLILCFFLQLPSFPEVSSQVKELKNLTVNIETMAADKKYKGYIFLKDGILYTSLEDLKQHLLFTYEYGDKRIRINRSSSVIEYKGAMIREGPDLYVPIISICEALGFQSNYINNTNTLNITKSLGLISCSNLWMSYNLVWGYVTNEKGYGVADEYIRLKDVRTGYEIYAKTDHEGAYFCICDPKITGNTNLSINNSTKTIYITGLQAIRYDCMDSIIVDGGTGPIVFITDYGTKYHMGGCQYLYDSALARPLSYVLKKGYEACEVCLGEK